MMDQSNDSGVNNLFKASEIYKMIQKYSAQILNQNRFGLVFCAGAENPKLSQVWQ